jgi:hypothetical protein
MSNRLLSQTRRWKQGERRKAVLPLIAAFEESKGRQVERARLYNQLSRLSKVACLKRAKEAGAVSRPQ